jgi:hypothetical protein
LPCSPPLCPHGTTLCTFGQSFIPILCPLRRVSCTRSPGPPISSLPPPTSVPCPGACKVLNDCP